MPITCSRRRERLQTIRHLETAGHILVSYTVAKGRLAHDLVGMLATDRALGVWSRQNPGICYRLDLKVVE